MAEQFSGAGKEQPEGSKVMLRCPTRCAALASENAVQRNPLEREPEAIRAKNGSAGMSLSAGKNLLIGRRERRFGARAGARNTTENGRRNGCTVTTGHLLWLNERRSAACLLPIRLPNPSFPGGKYNKKPTGPPRGAVSRVYPPGDLEPKSSYGIFVLMGASRTSHEH
jgi:hypothetical protein